MGWVGSIVGQEVVSEVVLATRSAKVEKVGCVVQHCLEGFVAEGCEFSASRVGDASKDGSFDSSAQNPLDGLSAQPGEGLAFCFKAEYGVGVGKQPGVDFQADDIAVSFQGLASKQFSASSKKHA